jgi:hypothetical protein
MFARLNIGVIINHQLLENTMKQFALLAVTLGMALCLSACESKSEKRADEKAAAVEQQDNSKHPKHESHSNATVVPESTTKAPQ